MVFVDSSVWVAYLSKDDARYAHSLRVLGSMKSEQLFVTSGIVFEVINFFFKMKGKALALGFLEFFQTSPVIEIIHPDELLWEQTVKIFSEHELSLTDAQIIAAMKKSGDKELVSFDRHFDQFKWVKRIG